MPSLTLDQLVIGKRYSYWNKSSYDKKPSLKYCKLLSILANDFVKVQREDLTVNSIQVIWYKRLREVNETQDNLR